MEAHISHLNKPFSPKEISKVVLDADPNITAGPDGFTARFFRTAGTK